jgi:hypothetical protein
MQILNRFVTDFVVLTPAKELLLIELEKPTTAILRKDGGIKADLQHAFDQVRGWLQRTVEHRSAVIDCLGLEPKEVSKISGVVIAGRGEGQDSEHLRRLKATDFGRVRFFTFDDLLGALIATTRTFGEL